MRKWKLAATATAASGILAVGMFAAFSLSAKAGTATGCTDSPGAVQTKALTCMATDTAINGNPIAYPLSITLTATTSTTADANGTAGLPVTFTWKTTCTEQSGSAPIAMGTATPAITDNDATIQLVPALSATPPQYAMDAIDPTTCDLTVTATVSGPNALTATGLILAVSSVESAAASPSASPSVSPTTSVSTPAPTTKYYNNQVHGFDGTCMDDKGNSSAERTKVIIWSCNDTDQAQGWTYSGDELKIHGVCLNAKGNGKSGSKLILWQCTGSGNEIFVHRSNGEFAEKANGYTVCLDDPAYSTKNGTQLTVYTCNNGANQHFTKP